jgi:hypothetical protein
MLTFKHYFHEKIRGSTFQALERLAESELASDIERLLGPVVSEKAFDVPRKPPEPNSPSTQTNATCPAPASHRRLSATGSLASPHKTQSLALGP